MSRPQSPLQQQTSCPDENALGAFVHGRANAEQRELIEQHLEHCSECGSVVQLLGEAFISRAQRADPGPESERDAPSLEPAAGQRLGRYRVDHGIGAGGMGLVFSAWDPALQRNVALKLLRPELATTREARERLLAEARAVASLKHPNVVGVFDVGEAEGRVFIAMELVDGVTLDRWCALTKPSLERLLDVFRQAGLGLAAAHAQGLVHRDFKPQNVLVTTDERVLVTDFGLALSSSETAQEVAGTPAYMAPEQRRGAASAASDQYSFALCLAETLGATLPVSGGAPELPTSVPDWLRAVLRRALAPDPAQRYSSLESLVVDLQGGSGVTASAHVSANAILLWGWTLLHMFWLVVIVWAGVRLWLDPSFMDPTGRMETQISSYSRASQAPSLDTLDGRHHLDVPSPYSDDLPEDDPLEDDPLTFGDGAVVAYALYWFSWTALGTLWAPLNALGLWRRRAWARVSSLLYAAFTGFSVLGLPYSGYAIYSLTRPQVVRLFSQVQSSPQILESGSVVKGQVHLMINALVQLGMWLLHLGLFVLSVEFLRFGSAEGTPETPLIIVLGLIAHGLGILWTPINAWGLYQRKRWARWSSLLYASCTLFTGVGLPYAVYAWVSLNLEAVKARLAHAK